MPETSAVTLSTAIAERLVRAELAHRPEITVAWMREALQLATGSTELTIQLSPSDFQALRQQAEELSNCLASLGKTQVVADATIAAGGCRVVTEFGSVDMQLQSQLDRIAQELIAE